MTLDEYLFHLHNFPSPQPPPFTFFLSDHRVTPDFCPSPVCDNDPHICPGTTVCADEAAYQFDIIDRICTYLFTVEYGMRLLTCWAVAPR